MVVSRDLGDVLDVIGDGRDCHRRPRVCGFPSLQARFDRGLAVTIEGLETRFIGILFGAPFPNGVGDEVGHEVDHHHAAIGRKQLENVVRNVAQVTDKPGR